jgi:hypothetical protein
MNANELANNLDKHYDFKKKFPQTADDVIIMLRQQQAEIESLLTFIKERGETGQLIIWKAREK